jgi:RNA recognition motif-containing protein
MGFGFVEFRKKDDAITAMTMLNGFDIQVGSCYYARFC